MMKSTIRKTGIALSLLAGCALISQANAGEMHEGYYLSTSENSFEDVVADLEDAIVNQGLVIDFNGHSGEMLERTAEALDTESSLSGAQYFNFCSAKLTHAAIAASPENMAICPYVVFAYQLKTEQNQVHLGYRRPIGASGDASEQALADIEALLKGLVDEASE